MKINLITKLAILLLIPCVLCTNITYDSVSSFKQQVLNLSNSEIKDLLDTREPTSEYYNYNHTEPNPIQVVYSGIGSCFYWGHPTLFHCRYYFKSNHPNNRRPSTYGQVYFGYPKQSDIDAGTGCMSVDGVRNVGCPNQNEYPTLCGGSLEHLLAEHVKIALNDPTDPCGLEDFIQYKQNSINTTQNTNQTCYITGCLSCPNQVDCEEWDPQYLDHCTPKIEDLFKNNDTFSLQCEKNITSPNNDTYFNFQFGIDKSLYTVDEDCLDFKVQFQQSYLQEGQAQFDEWHYQPNTQTISWNITLNDIYDTYNCTKTQQNGELQLICDINIYFLYLNSNIQPYSSKLILTLENQSTQVLSITLQSQSLDNTDDDKCCTNKLDIGTSIKFCSDQTCTQYIQPPYAFEINQPFYLEQSIVSSEFSDQYYLKLLSANLDAFSVQIIDQDSSQKGKTIVKLQFGIPLQNHQIRLVSQFFYNQPNRARRFMQENLSEKDLKTVQYIDISFSNKLAQQQLEQPQNIDSKNDQKMEVESENSNQLQLGLIIAVSVLASGILAYILVKVVKKVKKSRQDTYIEKY